MRIESSLILSKCLAPGRVLRTPPCFLQGGGRFDTSGIKIAQEAQGRQGKAEDASQAISGPGALRVLPGGDQVDGLPPALSRRAPQK